MYYFINIKGSWGQNMDLAFEPEMLNQLRPWEIKNIVAIAFIGNI